MTSPSPIIALTLAVAGSAAAGGAPPTPGASSLVRVVSPAILELPTHLGLQVFGVSDPDAAASDAVRDPAGAAEPGYAFRARVIIRADDARAVAAAEARHGAKAVPADPTGRALREHWFADAPTVRAAVALALALRAEPGIAEAYLDARRPIADRALPTDPLFPQQWNLLNATPPETDLNVTPAWEAGFTGAGVVVGILEGGWNIAHPDLAPQYEPDASQFADDPEADFSSHGTSTAGIAGAVANNAAGGVGVAFGSRLSRLYYGFASDIATAFLHRNDLNDVKSNSWGPPDSGQISAITSIELAALRDSVLLGRNGLGEVFVWAGGNGAVNSDRVDYDPYASNRYAVAVGAIDVFDRRSRYSEPGSSLMLVAPSDFDLSNAAEAGVIAPTGDAEYRLDFGGTSATAPEAAGVVALLLQARPQLTWRDVPHVLIRSARRCAPDDARWAPNGAGRYFNDDFGFGAIDAAAAVALAQSWTLVGPEIALEPPPLVVEQPIPDNAPQGVSSSLGIGANITIERAQVVLTAPHPSIGHLRILLTSPSGTQSLLAAAPRFDSTFGGYNEYTFTSVRHWDERADGQWTLTVADVVAGSTGTLGSWQLRLYGSAPRCPCDWDRSGSTDIRDIFAYLSSYFSGLADFNGSGLTEMGDLFQFLQCFFTHTTGC